MLTRARFSFTLCILFSAVSLAQTGKPAPSTAFTGTWFGSFNTTAPDGKPRRDNAVLVFADKDGVLTGSAGSGIDRQMPVSAVQIKGDELQFHMEAGGGIDFRLRRQGDHLVGAVTGKMHATVDVVPAPGLLPHEKLAAEIGEADHKLFAAFDSCDVAAYASFLSPDLEFYHDQGGRTGYQFQLDSLRQRCGEGLVLRRELVQDSLVVNAAPGFGAIEAGTHRFYAKQRDGNEHLDAEARFTEIWSKASGSWKLVRIISYDHHP